MKIKVNDQVKIVSGKDRGKTGKVIQTFPTDNRLVVEGINIMKKHLKTRKQGEKGQILELASPLNASKVSLLCPKCGKGVRVGYKMDGDKKKRWCRKCQGFID
jgi:large subunit ribosomal protein L24